MQKDDPAHKETDKILSGMEKELDSVYSQAYREARETANEFMVFFRELDIKKRQQLKNGDIDESEFKRWRRTMFFREKRYYQMADTLAADMTNVNKIAASILNKHLPEVYAINHNYGTYEVEHGSKINTQYTLYDRFTVERLLRDNPDLLPRKAAINVPEDIKWNKKKINSAVTQGILQGEDIDKISKRVADTVTDMNHTSAVRNARTMTTSAESGGRVDSYKRAESMGISMQQVWLATLDNRTRHEHRQLDGQKRAVGEPFEVEGNKIEFPGDPKAEPFLVYNCRCTLIGQVKGVNLDLSDVNQRDSKLGDMTYEEWKEEKAQNEPKVNKKSLDISNGNGIIKSITIDDFNESDSNNVITKEVKETILNTLKEENVSYIYDEVKIINIPSDSEGRIDPLRTNAIETPGYPIVILEINEAALGNMSLKEADYIFKRQKYCVSNSVAEAVKHEAAHAKVIGDRRYSEYKSIDDELKGGFFTDAIESREDNKSLKDLAGDISEYAQKDGLECISECHVKLSRGETIHVELKKLHDEYIK